MASFQLPKLQPDNDLWGPASGSNALPSELKDIPFAPYAKNDKVGRIADWNNASGASNDAANVRGGRQGRARDVQQNFGTSAASSAFAYFHGDDEASFSVVDNTRTAASRRGGLGQMSQRGGRGGRGGAGAAGGRGASKFGAGAGTRGARGGRGGAAAARRGGGRFGWKEWDKPQRIREASVTVGQDWEQVEEIDFVRLGKLRLEVEEPEDISTYGALFEYDRSYDRVTVKTAQGLSSIDRIRYNPTTSDDPVIQDISSKQDAKIYMTDSILALLMCATRSVYSWDIIITKTADGKVFFDKRDGGPFDYLTVNENAADPPSEAPEGKENEAAAKANALNAPSALSLEATYVNQNFAFQIVNEKNVHKLEHENPFYSSDETDPLASCAYRYRKFNLSSEEADPVELVVRTEVDAYTTGASKEKQLITIKSLNEFDSRAQGAGGAQDWRSKLDSQRGAVVATEMKNNSFKLARFAVQSLLAGADSMKLGYISRANPKDASRHMILGTSWLKPRELAGQMAVNLSNGWGIVRTIADLARKADEGKYVLLKDPNKQTIRMYRVPANFGEDNDDIANDQDADEQADA
ncbi:probable eukaryotic translation initiation factor 3 subunit 7 [Sporisorium reilianum f. sp. reilianum]|uniref:Eukaryotic translation initiation factor 3 subunit D n=1 Tax=Sporisorium reilianum f. sp. reilianum TaxID=72559 RepID=A0A2N8U9N2_9BASI|nr:probable eukaryotic translation initiation factor 3 subunit 7 [Sporisorium reilianum f. sp. reilianum]